MCKERHDLDECGKFNNMSIEEKRSFLQGKRMCFACYGYNHVSKGCLRKRTCTKCGKKHPTALHIEGFQMKPSSKPETMDDNNDVQASAIELASHLTRNVILHAIIPVRVQQGNGPSVITYAFYDNGSSGCFITEELEHEISAKGVKIALQLRTMHGKSFVTSDVIENLIVSDLEGGKR